MADPTAPGDKTYSALPQNAEQGLAASLVLTSGGKIALRTVEQSPSSGSGNFDYKTYEDASFVTGDSPATHDVSADLGRNGKIGYISNYGSGEFTVSLSTDGVTFGDEIRLSAGDALQFQESDEMSIDSIRVTWVSDTSYKIFIK